MLIPGVHFKSATGMGYDVNHAELARLLYFIMTMGKFGLLKGFNRKIIKVKNNYK